jgi:hypothetical protein
MGLRGVFLQHTPSDEASATPLIGDQDFVGRDFSISKFRDRKLPPLGPLYQGVDGAPRASPPAGALA